MNVSRVDVADLLKTLNSGLDGLTEAEAARRLTEYGPNHLEEVRGERLVLSLTRQFTHFFALILWLAAALAFVAERQDPGQGMATLGYAIIGVILINGLFSFWQEYRAEKALAKLRNLLPQRVKVVRQARVREIPAAELVPGDVILLQEGDDIPADCRLIEAFGVRVNTATVTGESRPQARTAAPCAEDQLLLSKNVVLAGTALVSGEGRAVVFATGARTEFGKIAHLTQTARQPVSPLQREILRLSHLVALLATLLGIGFFFIGQSLGLSFWDNFIFAIGIIVANVPEGLLPTVTLALAMATQRMARKNALVRHLPAVEALGSATVIVSDKTGTLTQNRMVVSKLFFGGKSYGPDELLDRPELVERHREFFKGALLCHNLKTVEREGRQELAGDPLEAALVAMARQTHAEASGQVRINEIPFDTERKRMSVLYGEPSGGMLYCKGALETILPLCTRVRSAAGFEPITSSLAEQLLQAQREMAEQGLRVLAFAHRELAEGPTPEEAESDLVLDGLAALEDPPRPEVPAAIQKCRDAGIRVIMVTGDHPDTAAAIAREIGLVRDKNPVVITGGELRRLSDTQLQLALDAPEILFARMGADQKMRIVQALKKKGETVAVTGDGVNDAPALKSAHIGIAMGLTGTDVAKESADLILLDDNFASIVNAVEEGRAVFDNIRKFMTYILTSNVPEIVPYLAFVLFRIPLPLTIIQILAVDLGTDLLPALALGAEKPERDIMRRPPRPRGERLLTWALVARAYLFLGPLEAVAALAVFFYVLPEGVQYGPGMGSRDPAYLQATTACLSAIIVMQIVNLFLCRHPRASTFSLRLFDNRLILWGIALEVILILVIDYTPWGNRIFGTLPIPPDVWLFVIPFALAMLLFEELRKVLVRAARRVLNESRGRCRTF